MTLIAAMIAVLISLAALWLANLASRQVDNTFKEFTSHLIKQVRDSQAEFSAQNGRLQGEIKNLERSVSSAERHTQDHAEKINTLTQRVAVLEMELKNLTDSIPQQYRRQVKKAAEK